MSIVMLSGPVGAGKTAVAQELMLLSPAPVCYIEGDTFWSFFAKHDGRDPRERFRLIMRSMTAAAVPMARGGYEVILDFSIPPQFLDTARKIVKELPLDFVVLRPSIGVCERRAANRGEGKIIDYAAYRDLYAFFDGAPQHMVSDDEADPRSLAQRIREGLDQGTFRVR